MFKISPISIQFFFVIHQKVSLVLSSGVECESTLKGIRIIAPYNKVIFISECEIQKMNAVLYTFPIKIFLQIAKMTLTFPNKDSKHDESKDDEVGSKDDESKDDESSA